MFYILNILLVTMTNQPDGSTSMSPATSTETWSPETGNTFTLNKVIHWDN